MAFELEAATEVEGAQTARVSYNADRDLLYVLRPDIVIDGPPREALEEPLDGLYLLRDRADGVVVGVVVEEAFAWDVLGNAGDEPWLMDRDFASFSVPTLGLRAAPLGDVVLAAQTTLTGSTPDVLFFDMAVEASAADEWPAAERLWRCCLAAGELKAHYGLGCTLLELGREREALGHLVTYTELTPTLAWAWAYRGRAAWHLGDDAEARACFERAIALEDDEDGPETDAAEYLAELEDVNGR